MKRKQRYVFIVLITILVLTISGCSEDKINNNSIKANSKEASNKDDNSNELQLKNLNSQIGKLKKIKEDKNMFLVNKDNKLPKEYMAENIVESRLPFLKGIFTTKLNSEVAENARQMFNDAKKEGVNLLGASGYRTNQVQKNLFESNVRKKGLEHAMKYSAPPGASEHETGYAIDIVSDKYEKLNSGFEKTYAFKWLKDNANKYGFILRYPKDKVDITKYSYEPWHYRYVGKGIADDIKKSGMCLEEYLDFLNREIKEIENNIKVLEDN